METPTNDENLFNTQEKGSTMNRLNGGHRSARLDTCLRGFRVAVISVPAEETKDQAWRRHVKKNPEDRNADIKIFSYAASESHKNSTQFNGEHRGRRPDDENHRNLVGG